jgi:hypothetical protein
VDADGLRDGGRSIAKRGPKTEAGKKSVRRNALKHGLRAVTPVVKDIEVPEIWQEHLEGMFESLQPDGYHERELARRIAELLWRLRRVSIYETDSINSAVNNIPRDLVFQRAGQEYAQKVVGIEPDTFNEEVFDRMVGVRMLPRDVTKITRYEAHLHRTYIQTLHELEALQARRRGERVPLARLDISGPPAG